VGRRHLVTQHPVAVVSSSKARSAPRSPHAAQPLDACLAGLSQLQIHLAGERGGASAAVGAADRECAVEASGVGGGRGGRSAAVRSCLAGVAFEVAVAGAGARVADRVGRAPPARVQQGSATPQIAVIGPYHRLAEARAIHQEVRVRKNEHC
jgi:hypothetical protein